MFVALDRVDESLHSLGIAPVLVATSTSLLFGNQGRLVNNVELTVVSRFDGSTWLCSLRS